MIGFQELAHRLFPDWDSIRSWSDERTKRLHVHLEVNEERFMKSRHSIGEELDKLAQRQFPRRLDGVRFHGRLVGKR